MSDTKRFRTDVVASAATGIGLAEGVTYSDIQQVMSHVLGFDIWTHELADRDLMERGRAAIIAQFPELPTAAAAKLDYNAARQAATFVYGAEVELAPGAGARAEGVLESAARIFSAARGSKASPQPTDTDNE